MITLLAWIVLALGLQLSTFIQTLPYTSPLNAVTKEDQNKLQVLYGTIRDVELKNFLLCSVGRCVRVHQSISSSWEGRRVWVEGVFKGNTFFPSRNGIDVVG